MVWTVADVDAQVKGLSDKQKKGWVAIANSTLARCEAAGKKDCEASAIATANAQTQKIGEAADWFAGVHELELDTAESATPERVDLLIKEADALVADRDLPLSVRDSVKGLRDQIKERRQPKESDVDIDSGFIPLVEKAMRSDGTVSLKLITPGWGTTGYYSKELLERDGPKVFAKDTKMYWNHPTATEERERPERDLRDLAAVLTTNAVWKESGPDGPGLYADAKVLDPYKESLPALAPHIGVSILARGRAKRGVAEGKEGSIIEGIVAARSVDFVTSPGAGGKIIELFESVRPIQKEEDGGMELKEAQTKIAELERENTALKEGDAAAAAKLKTAEDELGRLKTVEHIREAAAEATKLLAEIKLPDATKRRIVEAASLNPAMEEDDDTKIDKKKLKEAVNKAAEGEIRYLAEATGHSTGKITGMGGSLTGNESTEESIKEADAKLGSAFSRLGLSESATKVATAGRG